MSQFQRKNENLIQRIDGSEQQLTDISSCESSDLAQTGAKMPRSLSLKNRERIRMLFRSAKRRSSKSLTVFYRISPATESSGGQEDTSQIHPSQWLVAIPKRTGNAVKRNKIRRALRETIRLWPNRLLIDGEIAVRFNAPFARKKGSRNKQAPLSSRKSLVFDRAEIRELSRELLGLLEDILVREVNIEK